MASVLSMEKLAKYRQRGGEGSFALFSGMTAELEEGGMVALLGASGQGKSTLLRILAWLDAADEGELRLGGKPASAWKPQEWRTKVAYVAQQAVMLPGTVEDNLCTVSRLHRRPFDRALAARCMEALGLGGMAWSKPAGELSGGEKQRLALVRSLLLRPDVLLLDEVTASLDPHSRTATERLLREWNEREGTAQLWVTHDLEQARSVSRSVWFMAEGTLLENRETQDFFRAPDTEHGRRFIAGLSVAAAPGKEGAECPTWR
ncbi:ATP-binding cassette domain-containing protein [Paenibacillus sp. MZ04-78.2]|uniref:ABC transporter ATP-binding protein n=1 Tax=Paenibacillus sp. MZ04-78.2 TaxID=2962034 RepID=UPI0020B716A7|nr:ATP-binding cassette domain-containing protein [Paenibacillus sp. MZ04-78.2]MCP3772169.1 ATP-binding cassette domain-containing protein [Paenibacillus sp. MZ04-78.2]